MPISKALFFIFCAVSFGVSASADTVQITLLHTNDLHSHLRPEKTVLNLGGIARIKTAVDGIRRTTPNSLLVDGGDWSEGNIYYTLGAGRETIRMLDQIGYDVAVVGNHDWLNGPDTLLNAVEAANPKVALVGANFNSDQYSRAAEFKKWVQPYVIRDVAGVKIAFIGLGTYEFIYDSYFSPIKILDPYALTRDLAAKLKQQADVVVVISHNTTATNKKILQNAPAVDLIIGAHDHVKLVKPEIVQRDGAPDGWLVEAGCWGRYLGRVDLEVERSGQGSSVHLKNYSLVQMDKKIQEDPQILGRIAGLEQEIEKGFGPIFTDTVGTSEIEVERNGIESLMGDFATDVYRQATGTEVAIDERGFIYGELHTGNIHSADVFNAVPAIWSPNTQKTWTLNTVDFSGRTLQWIFNIFYSSNSITTTEALALSGVELVYKPIFTTQTAATGMRFGFAAPAELMQPMGDIKSITINGEPLDPSRQYHVGLAGGAVQALKLLDSYLPGIIPIKDLQDTGIESWHAMRDFIRARSSITHSTIAFGGRVRTSGSDLGFFENDIAWTELRRDSADVQARVSITVSNYGASPTAGGETVELLGNHNGVNLGIPEDSYEVAPHVVLPSLAPGQSKILMFSATLPVDSGLTGVSAQIVGAESEMDQGDKVATRFFAVK